MSQKMFGHGLKRDNPGDVPALDRTDGVSFPGLFGSLVIDEKVVLGQKRETGTARGFGQKRREVERPAITRQAAPELRAMDEGAIAPDEKEVMDVKARQDG